MPRKPKNVDAAVAEEVKVPKKRGRPPKNVDVAATKEPVAPKKREKKPKKPFSYDDYDEETRAGLIKLDQTVKNPCQAKRKRSEVATQNANGVPISTVSIIRNNTKLLMLGKTNMQDYEAVLARVEQVLNICAEDDMKPTLEKIQLGFGITRECWNQYIRGQIPAPERVVDLLKQLTDFNKTALVDFGMAGKVNPVTMIFLLKNNYGYSDRQEHVVVAANPLGDGLSAEEVKEKYADLIVDGVEELPALPPSDKPTEVIDTAEVVEVTE